LSTASDSTYIPYEVHDEGHHGWLRCSQQGLHLCIYPLPALHVQQRKVSAAVLVEGGIMNVAKYAQLAVAYNPTWLGSLCADMAAIAMLKTARHHLCCASPKTLRHGLVACCPLNWVAPDPLLGNWDRVHQGFEPDFGVA
jgi:hypothetical protein